MNFYTQGAQAALTKLGAVPFTGQEAQYFQELLKARRMGTEAAPVGPRAITELPPNATTIHTAPGARTEVNTRVDPPNRATTTPTGTPRQAQGMEALRSRLERVPGGGRQLSVGPIIPMEAMTSRQLGVPLHRTHTIEQFMGPASVLEEPGMGLARQMGKAEGAKALGMGAGEHALAGAGAGTTRSMGRGALEALRSLMRFK